MNQPHPFISLLHASAQTARGPVTLSPLQVELCFALASTHRAADVPALAEALWPDADPALTENRLHVAVHRLRRRVSDAAALERVGAGYRLGRHVGCDLPQIEAAVARLTRCSRGDAAALSALEEIRDELNTGAARQSRCAGPVGEAFGRRIDRTRDDVERWLAGAALAAGQFQRALDLAREAIERDGCDESALELAVRAHLGLRDRAAALRTFRHYARALQRELQLEPSPSVRELLR